MIYFQQGDVLLKPISAIPALAAELPDERILQWGEATGHAHRFAQTAPIRLYSVDGTKYLEVMAPSALSHEEHKSIDVPAGKYQIDIVREYDYDLEETRRVVD